jgi:predicted metal-dependent hydrolase
MEPHESDSGDVRVTGPSEPPDGSSSPTGSDIPVRRPSTGLSRDIPRDWYRGQAFASHFMDALSSTFPEGEAFFVRSVVHYREAARDRLDAPELLEAIRAFAGQEGQHSRLHADHVQLLLDRGYSAIETRNRWVGAILRWSNRRVPAASLAVTAALEHLTAILARQILSQPEHFCDAMHPEMAKLWRWHALEEAEHKSVAFDVLQRVAPSHRRRVLAQISNSIGLSIEIFDRLVYMLWKDGLLFRREGWAGGWRFLFGHGGLLRGVGKDYLAWYRRDFHPDEIDDRSLIQAVRPRVARELAG